MFTIPLERREKNAKKKEREERNKGSEKDMSIGKFFKRVRRKCHGTSKMPHKNVRNFGEKARMENR